MNRHITQGVLEFNGGIIQNVSSNSTTLFQNGSAFGTYNGPGTKDMQLDTSKPLTVQLSQTGTHALNTDGPTGRIIVSPSARIVDKIGEAGTLNKTGLGNLVFTGGNPVALNSWTGSTTVTDGKVMTDYSIIAGQTATGGIDILNNAYSAASQLVLNGGNFELKGRSSASAGTATGVTLPAGTSGSAYTVTVGPTASLVVGQAVANANLPAGTYIRRIINGTQIELNAMSTSTTVQTDQTLVFGAGAFANSQSINDVVLQQVGSATTITVTPGAGTSTTLLGLGNVSGSGGFTKAGNGTLDLTGVLAHTGDTVVNAGTLLIEGNGSAAICTISVAAGAALALGSSAVLGGPVISNGRVSPGTYHTNLTLNSTARVVFTVNGTANHDTLANDGGDTLAFENGATLELDFTSYTPAVGDTFTLFPNWAVRTGNASSILVMTTGLDPLYALDTTSLLANGSVSLRAVAGSPIATRPDGTLVRISNGERFYPVGFNFIRLNNQEDGHHSTFHVSDYDGPAATALFQRLALAGYTAVRVFVNSATSSPSGVGWQTSATTPLNPTYLDHFADFLKRAAAEGILVQPSMPWFPWNNRYAALIGPSLPMITGNNSGYFHQGQMAAREAFALDFWNGIRARYPDCAEALFCVDLENELNYDLTSEPFSLPSGTFNAANGQSYDLATQKQNLADDMAIYWVNRMSAVVRSVLPTTLINANVFSDHAVRRTGPGDFRLFGAGWLDRLPFRPRALAASNADIVDLHFYWESTAESVADFASVEFETFKGEAAAAGKALIVGEFGSLYAHIPANDPAAALAALPPMVDFFIDQGFQGWLLWTYDSIEQANHHLASDENFAIFNHLAQEIPGATGPELADNFGGSSFSQGWFQTTPANWSVTDGAATLSTISGLQQIYQYQDSNIFTDFRAATRFRFTGSGSGRGGIGFRKQEPDTTTGYSAFMTAAGLVLLAVYDPATAALVTLGSVQTSIDPFAGFVDLTVEAAGTRIKVWANGTLCLDVADDRWSAGYTSFFFDEIAGKIDLVAVNDISQLPDGAADEDGDGRTQSEEFIWGTSDTDAASFFRPAASFEPGIGFTLRWDALAHRRYTVWRSLTLAEGSWVPIFDTGVLAANAPLEAVDPASLVQPRAFYKIEGEYHGP